jgi:hypothetical protein
MNKIMLAGVMLAAIGGSFAFGIGSAHALRPLPPSHHPSAGFGLKISADGGAFAKRPPKKPICTTFETDCGFPGGKKDRPQRQK